MITITTTLGPRRLRAQLRSGELTPCGLLLPACNRFAARTWLDDGRTWILSPYARRTYAFRCGKRVRRWSTLMGAKWDPRPRPQRCESTGSTPGANGGE